jgi:hypothetical protein
MVETGAIAGLALWIVSHRALVGGNIPKPAFGGDCAEGQGSHGCVNCFMEITVVDL